MMAKRKIITEGNPALTKVCRETDITPKTIELLDDLAETVIDVDGAGLAAPQVGILRRVAVLYVDDEVIELINPVIIKHEGESEEQEGCLSVPGVFGMVPRYEKIWVETLNRDNKRVVLELDGLKARAAQHEMDHLDGVLFTSKVTKFTEAQ